MSLTVISSPTRSPWVATSASAFKDAYETAVKHTATEHSDLVIEESQTASKHTSFTRNAGRTCNPPILH
jgi:hypothetical protein